MVQLRICLLAVLLALGSGLKQKKFPHKLSPQKVPIWMYGEFGPGHIHHTGGGGYMDLCMDTIKQRLNKDRFDLHQVTSKNIHTFLPDMPKEFFRLDDGAKSDFIRASLIATHGGIYVDSDIAMRDNFDDLISELDGYETVVYNDKGQNCPSTFTTNFMMGKKGNALNQGWYDTLKEKLKSKCEFFKDRDTENGVCCYHPDGSARDSCHIPWGGISSPFRFDKVKNRKAYAFLEKAKTVNCLASNEAFAPDDLSGEMFWYDLTEKSAAKDRQCWLDEDQDLMCNKDGGTFRAPHFLKRRGYHLHRFVNFKQAKASKDEVLFGKMSKTVGSLIFRNLLFGEDFLDRHPHAQCYHGDGASYTPSKRLGFIHIPRTGGSTIEDCTFTDPNEKWGSKNSDLHGLTDLPQMGKMKSKCYRQHVPPSFIPESYADKDTFCVVRNPYKRAISQFGFAKTFYRGIQECSKESMNTKLHADLMEVKAGKVYHSDCHYIPQAAFVYAMEPGTGKIDTSKTSCNNVLHYEQLHEDFNKLAKSHGYPYELTNQTRSAFDSNKACAKLEPEDLSDEVKMLIQEVYADDFKLFGYTK